MHRVPTEGQTSKHPSTMLHSIHALWYREIVKFVRDRSRVIGALLQPLGFWILLGFGFGGTFQMPGAAESNLPYLEYLFPGIVALILLFTAIFSTISVVEDRQKGFLQAALVAPASRVSIVLGNVLGGATLAVAQALLFLLLAPLVGLTPSILGIAIIFLGALLTAVAFTALGFIMAWRLDTTRGFHAVMNLVLMPMWFLSGAVFPAEGAPAALRLIMHLNPAFYGVSALRDGLYWTSTEALSFLPHLGLVALFAFLTLAVATWTVRRPLYG